MLLLDGDHERQPDFSAEDVTWKIWKQLFNKIFLVVYNINVDKQTFCLPFLFSFHKDKNTQYSKVKVNEFTVQVRGGRYFTSSLTNTWK